MCICELLFCGLDSYEHLDNHYTEPCRCFNHIWKYQHTLTLTWIKSKSGMGWKFTSGSYCTEELYALKTELRQNCFEAPCFSLLWPLVFCSLQVTNTEHISITSFNCCANYRFQTSKTPTVVGIQLLGYEFPLHLFLCCSTKSTLSIEQHKFVFVPSTNKSTTVWLWMPVLAVNRALLLLLNCDSRELNGCTEKIQVVCSKMWSFSICSFLLFLCTC